jgi:hypothetical protein
MTGNADSMKRARDELTFAVDTLRKVCTSRADTKRLDTLITLLLVFVEDPERAARDLLEFVDNFERVLKSEKMEILYPFENVKIANHDFGSKFLEGYFDWNEVSYDPYEQLAIADKMLDDVEVAKSSLQKALHELKDSH